MVLIKDMEFLEAARDQPSPTYRYAAENAAVMRTFHVAEARGVGDGLDVEAYAQAVLGHATVETDNGGVGGLARYWIERETPASYPVRWRPDNPLLYRYLYCTSIPSATPHAAPAGLD